MKMAHLLSQQRVINKVKKKLGFQTNIPHAGVQCLITANTVTVTLLCVGTAAMVGDKGEVKVEKCHFCAAINNTKTSVLCFWRNEAAHQKSIITSKVDFNIQHYAAQKAAVGGGGDE